MRGHRSGVDVGRRCRDHEPGREIGWFRRRAREISRAAPHIDGRDRADRCTVAFRLGQASCSGDCRGGIAAVVEHGVPRVDDEECVKPNRCGGGSGDQRDDDGSDHRAGEAPAGAAGARSAHGGEANAEVRFRRTSIVLKATRRLVCARRGPGESDPDDRPPPTSYPRSLVAALRASHAKYVQPAAPGASHPLRPSRPDGQPASLIR